MLLANVPAAKPPFNARGGKQNQCRGSHNERHYLAWRHGAVNEKQASNIAKSTNSTLNAFHEHSDMVANAIQDTTAYKLHNLLQQTEHRADHSTVCIALHKNLLYRPTTEHITVSATHMTASSSSRELTTAKSLLDSWPPLQMRRRGSRVLMIWMSLLLTMWEP